MIYLLFLHLSKTLSLEVQMDKYVFISFPFAIHLFQSLISFNCSTKKPYKNITSIILYQLAEKRKIYSQFLLKLEQIIFQENLPRKASTLERFFPLEQRKRDFTIQNMAAYPQLQLFPNFQWRSYICSVLGECVGTHSKPAIAHIQLRKARGDGGAFPDPEPCLQLGHESGLATSGPSQVLWLVSTGDARWRQTWTRTA